MIVDVPVVGKIGDVVTSYFADFGRLSGVIIDAASDRFLLEMRMGAAERVKMSNQLIWLEKKQKDASISDVREASRFIPEDPHSTLTLADGTARPCLVIDLSASGIAVSSDVQPAVGTPLAVGACVGRVVRALPNGFAVQFVEKQKRHEIERLSTRTGGSPGGSFPRGGVREM